MNNRKHISYSNFFGHLGEVYPINTTQSSGCFTPILKAGIDRLTRLLKRFKRIFVYFFGLHSHSAIATSSHVSRFFNKVRFYCGKIYRSVVGYVWVREQERADTQHYHAVIILDGDKIQHSKSLAGALKRLWEQDQSGSNTINFVKNPFYYVTAPEQLKEVVLRFSYYAKERGKGRRPAQAKDFGASRLR